MVSELKYHFHLKCQAWKYCTRATRLIIWCSVYRLSLSPGNDLLYRRRRSRPPFIFDRPISTLQIARLASINEDRDRAIRDLAARAASERAAHGVLAAEVRSQLSAMPAAITNLLEPLKVRDIDEEGRVFFTTNTATD